MYLRSEGQVLKTCSSWLVPRFSHAAKPQHLSCGILRRLGLLPSEKRSNGFEAGARTQRFTNCRRGQLVQDRQDARGSDQRLCAGQSWSGVLLCQVRGRADEAAGVQSVQGGCVLLEGLSGERLEGWAQASMQRQDEERKGWGCCAGADRQQTYCCM